MGKKIKTYSCFIDSIKYNESFIDDMVDINKICEKYVITNYLINSDGSIDVEGDVDLFNKGLTKLPLKFGKVSGDFCCSGNELTSLEGCPTSIGGYFNCDNNKLESLKGGPISVGGGFHCYINGMISLEGGPKEVGGEFDCSYNKLTSLEGCPNKIGDYFDCEGNPVYEVWKLIDDKQYLELFLDYDMIDGDELNLIKLNDILSMIGKKPKISVSGYKCI